jgi:hypothetical protein
MAGYVALFISHLA